VSARDNARIVYSTATDGKCPVCGWPQRNCQCSSQRPRGDDPVPARVVAKLRVEKKGRGGKTVTMVYDLPRNEAFLKGLGQQLKRTCGTGGAVGDGTIELQGDLRDRVRAFLQQLGYLVKG
jgi:translation initiation factor 1